MQPQQRYASREDDDGGGRRGRGGGGVPMPMGTATRQAQGQAVATPASSSPSSSSSSGPPMSLVVPPSTPAPHHHFRRFPVSGKSSSAREGGGGGVGEDGNDSSASDGRGQGSTSGAGIHAPSAAVATASGMTRDNEYFSRSPPPQTSLSPQRPPPQAFFQNGTRSSLKGVSSAPLELSSAFLPVTEDGEEGGGAIRSAANRYFTSRGAVSSSSCSKRVGDTLRHVASSEVDFGGADGDGRGHDMSSNSGSNGYDANTYPGFSRAADLGGNATGPRASPRRTIRDLERDAMRLDGFLLGEEELDAERRDGPPARGGGSGSGAALLGGFAATPPSYSARRKNGADGRRPRPSSVPATATLHAAAGAASGRNEELAEFDASAAAYTDSPTVTVVPSAFAASREEIARARGHPRTQQQHRSQWRSTAPADAAHHTAVTITRLGAYLSPTQLARYEAFVARGAGHGTRARHGEDYRRGLDRNNISSSEEPAASAVESSCTVLAAARVKVAELMQFWLTSSGVRGRIEQLIRSTLAEAALPKEALHEPSPSSTSAVNSVIHRGPRSVKRRNSDGTPGPHGNSSSSSSSNRRVAGGGEGEGPCDDSCVNSGSTTTTTPAAVETTTTTSSTTTATDTQRGAAGALPSLGEQLVLRHVLGSRTAGGGEGDTKWAAAASTGATAGVREAWVSDPVATRKPSPSATLLPAKDREVYEGARASAPATDDKQMGSAAGTGGTEEGLVTNESGGGGTSTRGVSASAEQSRVGPAESPSTPPPPEKERRETTTASPKQPRQGAAAAGAAHAPRHADRSGSDKNEKHASEQQQQQQQLLPQPPEAASASPPEPARSSQTGLEKRDANQGGTSTTAIQEPHPDHADADSKAGRGASYAEIPRFYFPLGRPTTRERVISGPLARKLLENPHLTVASGVTLPGRVLDENETGTHAGGTVALAVNDGPGAAAGGAVVHSTATTPKRKSGKSPSGTSSVPSSSSSSSSAPSPSSPAGDGKGGAGARGGDDGASTGGSNSRGSGSGDKGVTHSATDDARLPPMSTLRALDDRHVHQYINKEFSKVPPFPKFNPHANHRVRLLSGSLSSLISGSTSNSNSRLRGSGSGLHSGNPLAAFAKEEAHYRLHLHQCMQRIFMHCFGIPRYFAFILLRLFALDDVLQQHQQHVSGGSMAASATRTSRSGAAGGNGRPVSASALGHGKGGGAAPYGPVTALQVREFYDVYLKGKDSVRRVFDMLILSSRLGTTVSAAAAAAAAASTSSNNANAKSPNNSNGTATPPPPPPSSSSSSALALVVAALFSGEASFTFQSAIPTATPTSGGDGGSSSGSASLTNLLLSHSKDDGNYNNNSSCSNVSHSGTSLHTSLGHPQQQQPLRSYLLAEDFAAYVNVILQHHPGLTFLGQTPDFQAKYLDTVIYRIFYELDRRDVGTISFREFTSSRLVDAMRQVDATDDINAVLLFFSYEHFYVLYCRFWELDEDRDMMLSKTDLVHYQPDNVMNPLLVDRIFRGIGRPIRCPVKGKIGYEDFVWYCLSEEDKSTPRAIRYWFRLLDLDGDGVISAFELNTFYDATREKIAEYVGGDGAIAFGDVVCQVFDMMRCPQSRGLTLADFLQEPEAAAVAFNMITNVVHFLQYEQKDPFVAHMDRLVGSVEQSAWDRFARMEYDRMAQEVDA